ncbi:hypothetical protein [Hyalangium minutum]|uniref:Uncharacterized protein n=1 Tax=Hyalangium minutum TaxID=394096 RepID=A0A085W5S1_9BACT|nr:hypothetical protein [Hyalangium minutum]KFE63034.1 hypothetical protein DB31_3093 [Hyalangium minutum]
MRDLSFEQRLRERIRGFDMPALLVLLKHKKYALELIEYRSHRTLVHQSHLVHDIQFSDESPSRVIITVNIGLLSVQSPLPTFLHQTMNQLDPLESERMERFLGYFDHELLRARFAGLYPERSASLLPGWEEAAQNRLSLLSLTSPSTLHWLFAQVFPEAEVSVRREVRTQAVPAHGSQLGVTALGDSTALGGFASVPTGGMEVTVFFNESHCGIGTPWAMEAPLRLSHRLLPVFSQSSAPLTAWMVLRDPSGPARLQPDNYLGYVPLAGTENLHQRLLLFRGNLAHPTPDTSSGQIPSVSTEQRVA